MSFRKYGGMNYAATHNIVKSNVNTADSLYVTNNVGQTNSYINFNSDISGNVLIFGDLDLSGNLNVSGDIDCSGNLTVDGKSYFNGDMNAYAIYLPGTKSASEYADNEVVPKSYVDTASQGLSVKSPCSCIATNGVTITNGSGTDIPFDVTTTYSLGLIIDGYDLSGNFSTSTPTRVLVNNQGTPDTSANILNGIYDVSGNANAISFVRSSDMLNGSNALGAYTFIEDGTVDGRTSWVQNQQNSTSGAPVIVGTDALFFSEYQSFKYRIGRGLDVLFNSGNSYTYLNLDTSLTAINYLDNNYTGSINPGSNTGTINIGAYTQNINIGGSSQINQINIAGTVIFSGAVFGTTGAFSGALSGTTGAFSGAVSGTTGTFSGAVSGANFNATSDYRIKENVTPLDDTFVVDNLNPVTYTNTTTQKQDVGFIAHELQEQYPFLVNGIKDGEHLQSVNYIGLIGVLIKEIQYLKKEVSLMSLQIVQLQNK